MSAIVVYYWEICSQFFTLHIVNAWPLRDTEIETWSLHTYTDPFDTRHVSLSLCLLFCDFEHCIQCMAVLNFLYGSLEYNMLLLVVHFVGRTVDRSIGWGPDMSEWPNMRIIVTEVALFHWTPQVNMKPAETDAST